MLTSKHCHQGLRPRSNFFGLEPLDLLVLFPGIYICIVFLHRPFIGLILTGITALAIRVLKWGRLPGYTLSLATYLFVRDHNPVLGHDNGPHYPSTPGNRPC